MASHLFFRMCIGDTLSRAKKRPCSVDYRRWDELPDELMEIILQHTDIADRFSMSMVCTSWESILKHRKNEFRIPPQFPWLLLPHNPEPCAELSFYDLSRARLSHFKIPTWIQSAVCCGSSKGWLIMSAKESPIFLFNPISGSTHKLPSLKSLADDFSEQSDVQDFAWTIELSSEDPTNCIAASYIGSKPNKVAFCRVGSQNWSIYNDYVLENHTITQVLFSNDGKILYALKYVDEGESMSVTTYCFKSIDYELTLKTVPISYTSPIFVVAFDIGLLDRHTSICQYFSSVHLVESNNGEILLIQRVTNSFHSFKNVINDDDEEEEEEICLTYVYPKEFEIYMLHASHGTSNMTKLTSLDNQILFLSFSGLSLVQSKEFPNLQGNCIYFIEDGRNNHKSSLNFPHVSRESGIYHLDSRRIDRCFPSIELPMRSHTGWFNPNSF